MSLKPGWAVSKDLIAQAVTAERERIGRECAEAIEHSKETRTGNAGYDEGFDNGWESAHASIFHIATGRPYEGGGS